MKILLIEPFFSGSHKSWAEGFQESSDNDIDILSLEGKFWKWRMRGGAITLARKFNSSNLKPDLILVTDMLDLTTFLSLTRKKTYNIPTVIYFHENQFSYPSSKTDSNQKNNIQKHYGFINYSSALVADHILFNSNFHQKSFIKDLESFLRNAPDHNELETLRNIDKKSHVLYLGLDLKRFDNFKTNKNKKPLLLWNHRWEYDKDPESFFKILFKLKNDKVNFELAILGENHQSIPSVFNLAKDILSKKIVHFGYCDSFDEYARWLWKADILPVTNIQDFFGISIMEAIYCNTYPLLPKRLTYPELLHKQYHPNNLYSNEDDLYNKLKNSIINIEKIRKLTFNKIAQPYDWSSMKNQYDQLFLSFIK